VSKVQLCVLLWDTTSHEGAHQILWQPISIHSIVNHMYKHCTSNQASGSKPTHIIRRTIPLRYFRMWFFHYSLTPKYWTCSYTILTVQSFHLPTLIIKSIYVPWDHPWPHTGNKVHKVTLCLWSRVIPNFRLDGPGMRLLLLHIHWLYTYVTVISMWLISYSTRKRCVCHILNHNYFCVHPPVYSPHPGSAARSNLRHLR